MERLIDLENRHLRLLRELLSTYLTDKAVWAYGSRVKWKASPTSDLDLVVWGATDLEVDNAKEAFVESDLPFTVQLLIWEDIPENFKENIRKKYVVLQEANKIPKGWREVRLGDIISISSGKGLTKNEYVPEGEYPVFGANGKIGRTNKYLSDERLIYTGRVGTLGKIFILNEKAWLTDNTLLIRPRLCFFHYVYFLLKNLKLERLNIGSTQPLIKQSDIKDQKVFISPPPEQKAIAEVLLSLDDKIDLLHRQNKTLENLAQALFRQWFVEEAYEGWDKVTIEDVCQKINSGGTPLTKVPDYYRGNINWYSTKELKDNFLFESTNKITRAGLENSSAKIFPENTIVIAIYAAPTVGRLGILANEATFNQAACGLVVDENKICYEYLYLHLLLSRHKLHDIASGSAQQNLNVGIMKAFEIVVPSRMIMQDFKLQVRAMFQKIKYNASQIRTLERLRDTLLPKLMSGEIEVKN